MQAGARARLRSRPAAVSALNGGGVFGERDRGARRAASYLTAWPTGSAQPLVSTLNSFDGSVVANAAIVPAGTNGAVSIYVTNQTHVILDINGYFAP